MAKGADVHITTDTPAGPRTAIAIGLFVTEADQQWIDQIRQRSYELAIQRGHIRS